MKKTLLGVLAVLLIVGGVTIVRALGLESQQGTAQAQVDIPLDESAAAARFSAALQFRTISFPPPAEPDTAQFFALHRYLASTYPGVHEQLSLEGVGPHGLSMLYTWEGRDPDRTPVVLMGHQDVVPIIPGTEAEWTHPPFSGRIADGYVWGRGSMDDKSSVLAILEAVELLVAAGFQPERTYYLAFGHDEELGGTHGAAAIAALLESRGAGEFALVLDEGGAITEGLLPGVEGTTAIIGIGEKGYLSLDLVARAEGGHSSTPPATTAIGILANAIERLESNPFPADLDAGGLTLLEAVAPEMPFVQKLVFANRWLFDPLIKRLLNASPETSAMLRTTTAATMLSAGVKDNVLPIDAKATVNFRILPGETVESVTARVQAVIDDDRIEVTAWPESGRNPSAMSDPEGEAFEMLARTIRQTVPGDVLVAPYLVMGGTDAKYYSSRSTNVFRFLAAKMEEGDMVRVHGTNERLSVASFGNSIRFFVQLIRNTEELP